MATIQLLGAALGLGFVSGINLYATILAVGAGIHMGLIHPGPGLEGLLVLGHPLVLMVAGACYVVEFIADKIPWLDSAWDAMHTFVRPLGAAVLAATALGSVDPALELAAALLAGSAALSTHTTKAGVRLVANTSPEPFTNVALSLVEDVIAVVGAWLVLDHPLAAGAAALAFLLGFVVLLPWFARVLRAHWLGVTGLLRALAGRRSDSLVDELPPAYATALPDGFGGPDDVAVRCIARHGLGARPHQVGYLCLRGSDLVFLVRRGFRVRAHRLGAHALDEVRSTRGLLFDRLTLRTRLTAAHLDFPRDCRGRLAAVLERLRQLREGAAAEAA
jgi:hypothetical protein